MFNSFQNDSGILHEIEIDGFGSRVQADSINVSCDVQFETRLTYNNEGEEVQTRAHVFVTPNNDLNDKSISQLTGTWDFEYKGETFNVERLDRIRKPARDIISHYEIWLR